MNFPPAFHLSLSDPGTHSTGVFFAGGRAGWWWWRGVGWGGGGQEERCRIPSPLTEPLQELKRCPFYDGWYLSRQ